VVKVAAILTIFLMSSTGLAQSEWARRFLDRYSPPKAQSSTVPVSAPPLPTAAMVQGGVLSVTTEDIVRLMLENNRDLTVSRVIPISSLYSIGTLFRTFEPNFHVLGAVTHTKSPSSNVLAGAASLVQFTHDYQVGVDQTLQTGTIYSVDFYFNRTSSNSVFNVVNPAYNGTVRYGITQHLLRDFGRSVNSHEIRIARNDEKISELKFELQIIEMVTQALQSYWDLLFALEDLKVKQRSLDLASKTLEDNRVEVQIGTMAPIELVQAETEVATRNEDLVTARYNIEQLQDQMKKLISNETDPGFVLARLNLIEPTRQPGGETILPLTQAIQFALENRREMKQADYDVSNQEVNLQFTKNQKRAVLDLTAGFAHKGLGGPKTLRSGIGQGNEILQVIPGGVGEMFSQLFAFQFPDYSAGFNLQIPLRNRAAQADYDRALNERELATMRKAAIAQQIALEVRNAYTQIDMNRARVATARTTRELSSRKLEAEQTKFELGASTIRFVLEEQRNLAQAETNEIQALVNYTKALVIYDRAIGNTLTRNNIELEKQLPAQLTSTN
jgi:outer membrane protein